jgi:hypothetical protein
MYDTIAQKLAEGGQVTASTPDFGKKGGGISGGEDTESVPGLVGSHVYAVIAVPPMDKDGRRFLRLRNPWGSTGLGYDDNFKKHKVLSDGTFDIELSDFARYFTSVDYSSSSATMMRTFALAAQTARTKPKKKK